MNANGKGIKAAKAEAGLVEIKHMLRGLFSSKRLFF
jgi:hypothetical protein